MTLESGIPHPVVKKTIRVSSLRSQSDVTREMRSIYKQARRGEIPIKHFNSFIYGLNILLGAIREEDLALRIAHMENQLNKEV